MKDMDESWNESAIYKRCYKVLNRKGFHWYNKLLETLGTDAVQRRRSFLKWI